MTFIMQPKTKYTRGGSAKKGAAAGSGDSTKRRPQYHKASDAEKRRIAATQERRFLVVFGDMAQHANLIRESKLNDFITTVKQRSAA